jgi:riboflavin synthase
MFTGLVSAVGQVVGRSATEAGLELSIAAPYPDLELGESIAVDGACLTVQTLAAGEFTVHVISTSLERTGFSTYEPTRKVNLERALRVGDRLGGHIVQGHVDGLGTVLRVARQDDARLIDVQMPIDVARVTVPLGSITLDGVSLTVNALPGPAVVQVSLIPFTLQHTTLGERRPGDRVHLEADALGKYVAELLRARGDLGAP